MNYTEKESELIIFRNVFDDPAVAESTIRDHIGSVVKITGKDKSDFKLSIDLRGNKKIYALDAVTRRGGALLYESTFDRIGIKAVIRGHEKLIFKNGSYELNRDTGAIFDVAKLIGYETSSMALVRTVFIERDEFDAICQRYLENRIQVPDCISFSSKSRIGSLMRMGIDRFFENYGDTPFSVYSAVSARLIREALVIGIAEVCLSYKIGGDRAFRGGGAGEKQTMRALEIIKAQTAPLSVHEVADAIGVGVRALQIGFRRHLGVPPNVVLRRGRLEGVRRDLESGAASSVREAAIKWGFSNLGRFANEYFVLFGEYPSSTLRRNDK